MKIVLFLLISICGYGQQLHHQMLSAQGSSSRKSKGVFVKQTVGQQSAVGNFFGSNKTVGQGFQQSSYSKTADIMMANRVVTRVYPNPFVDQIQFEFSEPITGPISIAIFDMLGRLIFSDSKAAINSILTLDHLNFPENEYLVKLTASKYNFATSILKTK